MNAQNLIAQLLDPISPNQLPLGYDNIIPYLILLINFLLFKLLRSLTDALFNYKPPFVCNWWPNNANRSQRIKRSLRLFILELISTCELCADCAELNVVYEKHGAYAYAAGLFLLTYLWMDSFGEAQTSPGYLAEELFLVQGKQLLRNGETYSRFLGQSIALPLGWRFASLYWHYHLLAEHKQMIAVENCKSSLTTGTLKGFLIEFGCCLMCRLIELVAQQVLEQSNSGKRLISVLVSFSCTLLVMLALELSGGYFNPILAASLEYGCKGIRFHQHAIVFWLGPLLGHVLARLLYRRLANEQPEVGNNKVASPTNDNGFVEGGLNGAEGRPKRRTSERRKRHRD